MGLASFFAFFRGDAKPKPNNTSSPRRQNAVPRKGWADYGRSQDTSTTTTALPAAPKNTFAPDARHNDRSERSERRKSRTPTVPRPTSKKSNRRSWFGGRPGREDDVPAVPRLVKHTTTTEDSVRPGTAITTDTIETQGRRHSIARSLSRKKSWFKSQEPQVTVEALPPMPVTINQPTKAATSTLPADQRRRRNSVKTIERRGSTASTVRPKVKKRSSFWASSNPDDSDSDVPPVPALIRDGTPDSNSNASSDDNQPARRTARGDGIKQPRPLSTVSTSSRKSYTPKSAAKGFLKSTNGASEEQRKSFRQSFHLEDESDLVCLTEEQRIEWAKLMNNQSKFEERPATEVPQTKVKKNNVRYSNAQALAALEFNVR
ncbi:hypothetical protein M409DRAFT_17763 [Zasmidium cellare ATCC 36951]|uniref:Uncharacterized protein n=1 Tax=Zasmidium cellare ATCC 36951 TaxID=1080233 RepID=A0A6A6D2X2_ZASCE|nr:uncharacterized protein M409DRAFT_17763 [Zasmidium cellare ATCC 36951]KAF2172532.1 hypothetical protein M409DRAFT_17763 [Zasmidium cellare ATCC 36951]